MPSAPAVPPPPVEPVLQLGLIGHRQLPPDAIEPIRSRARDVLAQVAAAFQVAAARGASGAARQSLRCICSLAEGADTLLAREAIAAGYRLSAPLPCHRERYAEDFTAAEGRNTLTDLLAQAAGVYELDGEPGQPASCQAAARVLLDQSDILIAVWDGAPTRGPGGTAETVRAALALEIPVVVIGPTGLAPIQVLHEGFDGTPGIADAVALALGATGAAPQNGLTRYLAEDTGRRTRIGGLLHSLENILLALAGKPFRRRPAVPPPEADLSAAVASPAVAEVERVLAPDFDAADGLAVRYAAYYRLAATLRYLSVVPATIGGLLIIYAPPVWSRLGIVLQVAALAGSLLIAYADHRAKWHARFLDYRLLAEHLRSARLLALFGAAGPFVKSPPHLAASTADWVNARLREDVRTLGLVSARVDGAYLAAIAAQLRIEIDNQLQFYAARSGRFGDLGHILGRVGVSLFAGGIVLTLLRQVIAAFGVYGLSYDLLAGLALAVPALAPVFLGIQSQNEYRQLSQRYSAMARQLSRIDAKAKTAPAELAVLETLARNLVAVMLAEVSDWRSLIGTHGISAV